jgi:hypothetical protein
MPRRITRSSQGKEGLLKAKRGEEGAFDLVTITALYR